MYIPSYLSLKKLRVGDRYDCSLRPWLKHPQNTSSPHMYLAALETRCARVLLLSLSDITQQTDQGSYLILLQSYI